MAGQYATKMLRVYRETPNIARNMFLSSFFVTSPEDITDSEFIEIDIVRSDEEIAPVLTDISTGANMTSEDIYTGKQFKPPAFREGRAFNVYDLLKRVPGSTQYEMDSADKMAILMGKVRNAWTRLTERIKRTIELQAAQILQTGTVTLYDAAGNARYTLNFVPKASHFPTAAIAWGAAGSAPLVDINNLSETIRDDGLVDCKNLIMGPGAFAQFLNNADVQLIFRRDSFALGTLSPRMQASGATIQGFIPVGNYQYNIWTYGGRFIDPVTHTKIQYLNWDSCILMPDPEDLDFRKVFGGVPVITESTPPFNEFLPDRVVIPGAFDFKPRVYVDEKAETLVAEVASRPLLIPVSIDRYGCIDTNAAT
jgi:hypothetical protein